jgi:hypothetical protein
MSQKKEEKNNLSTIENRLISIKKLIEDSNLSTTNPLKNLDEYALTECFTVPKDKDSKSQDTRTALNKKTLNFYNIINKMESKLIYIKSGAYGHTFKGIIADKEDNEIQSFAVKVVAYPKRDGYGTMHNITRPENAEICMLKLLSYFVIKGQTPHIILPISIFDTSIKPFLTLQTDDPNNTFVPVDNKNYKDFIKNYKHGKYYEKVSVVISEWANRGDLGMFLKKNYKKLQLIHWQSLFFQLLSVLAIIQSKYPTFRHNDFKANNILIQKIDLNREYYRYLVVGMKYKVPNIGYQIKLWDFDFACIPGIVDNIKVSSKWTKKINITPEQNRYYDIHYFFNTLIRKGFFPQILTDSIVPREVKEFIGRVVPQKYRDNSDYVHEKGRILINDEYTTPDELLKKDIFFAEFRNEEKQLNKTGEIKYDFNKMLSIERTENKNITFKKKGSKKSSRKSRSNKLHRKTEKENTRNIDLLKLLGSDIDKTKDKLKFLEDEYLK